MSHMILDHAAKALSKMQMPKFDIGEEAICSIVEEMFGGKAQMKDCDFNFLKDRVAELSSGAVTLEKVDYSEWKGPRVKGAASYLVLKRGDESVRFIFGPAGDPFIAVR